MKIIKVIYDDNSTFIIDIINNLNIKVLTEFYNVNHYKERRKALPIMTRFGTAKVPLLVFEDENLKEYTAIWSEQNPDWAEEIIKKLMD
jgi:uncharacterized membrane protein YoaT (DUF817 family)